MLTDSGIRCGNARELPLPTPGKGLAYRPIGLQTRLFRKSET